MPILDKLAKKNKAMPNKNLSDNDFVCANNSKNQLTKVLLLGSGGLSIGQAGEFDYSGTQALRALLDHDHIEVIIVNPNIATVQTNPEPRTKIYLYPVNCYWVEKIIAKERPDAILAGFGGQTALKCLLDLDSKNVLEKYQVLNLGTHPDSLRLTEDRDLFAQKMKEIGVPTPPSYACETVDQALKAANKIGYPVIARMAYALGGLGSGFASNDSELLNLVEGGLAYSFQVLIEKSLKGWKEVEYEVMRDSEGNKICICNMENFDPLGIHTGDSIVVCPSQTLTDNEYQLLRDCSLYVAEFLNICGECNMQFALSPDSSEFYIIEVNARLSRSSALASKASGYPIAFVAAKVVMGYNLLELKNPVTGVTCAFYEPSLDYVTIKIPRWDLVKFKGVGRHLGSTMKSVGEIMAIGRSFGEALQKSVRSITEKSYGLSKYIKDIDDKTLQNNLKEPTDQRLYEICLALKKNYSVQKIHQITSIDLWFLHELYLVINCQSEIFDFFSIHLKDFTMSDLKKSGSVNENDNDNSTDNDNDGNNNDFDHNSFKVNNNNFDHDLLAKIFDDIINSISFLQLKHWKSSGFADEQIIYIALTHFSANPLDNFTAKQIQNLSLKIRKKRLSLGIIPYVKKIDTTSAEYPSPSNYLYMSYFGDVHDYIKKSENPSAVIIGGGSYRIGTSVEFDWCAVSSSKQLRKNNWNSIIVNCNPETVSTDYNESDQLYFEEITLERILDICDFHNAKGVVASMGGQLPNSLALPLFEAGINLLGHSAKTVDLAEDRSKFSQILDDLNIDQPRWTAASSMDHVEQFCKKVGYPVLLRTSYVLSGAAMKIAHDDKSLRQYLQKASDISSDHPVVISEFITGARELEVDGVALKGQVLIYIVSEHVENAGVHSGDATTVVPAQRLYVETVRQVKKAVRMIAKKLCLNGAFNIQFLAQENHIKVIECNARAARSFPFISKLIGCHLADIATDVMIGKTPKLSHFSEDQLPHVGVKAALFSFTRLRGADPVLGVEMASTGEVGCVASDFDQALLLALEASKINPPKKGLLVSAGHEKNKLKFLQVAKYFQKHGIKLYGTKGTAQYLLKRGIEIISLDWPDNTLSGFDQKNQAKKDVIWSIRAKKVDFVVNIPKNLDSKELTNGARIRQAAVNYNCSLITDIEKTVSYFKAYFNKLENKTDHEPVALLSWNKNNC